MRSLRDAAEPGLRRDPLRSFGRFPSSLAEGGQGFGNRTVWSMFAAFPDVIQPFGNQAIDERLRSQRNFPPLHLGIEYVSYIESNLLADGRRQRDLVFRFDLYQRHVEYEFLTF